MKWLFKAVFVLLSAVALALALLYDPGFVYIQIGRTEMEIALFAAILVVVFVTFFGIRLWRLIRGLWNLSSHAQEWYRQRHINLARQATHRGMLALSVGRWRLAERELIRYMPYAEMPLINYLSAARAAQNQGAIDRRDYYLQRAHECDRHTDVPVGLAKAELHISQNQLEQALAILTQLKTLAPENAYVLKLLCALFQKLEDWSSLRDLLPVLRRGQVVNAEELEAIEYRVYSELLKTTGSVSDLPALQGLWDKLSKKRREDPRLISIYARRLLEMGETASVELLLRNFLKKNWNERLVYLYAQINLESANKQLTTVEALAEEHGKNPVLLLSLGKLCIKSRLWGKARIYLESSIGAGATPEAYRELGQLLERLGDRDGALDNYRKAIQLAMVTKV